MLESFDGWLARLSTELRVQALTAIETDHAPVIVVLAPTDGKLWVRTTLPDSSDLESVVAAYLESLMFGMVDEEADGA